MSDIIVGSVGVRLVPNAEGFEAKTKALTRGLTTDVKFKPETAEVDAERQKQQRTPLKVPVTPDRLDLFASRIKSETAGIAKSAEMKIPLTADGEKLRRDLAAQTATINRLLKVEIPVDIEGATSLRNKMALELDILKTMAASADPTVTLNATADTAKANLELDYAARDRTAKIDADTSGLSGALGGLLGGLSSATGGLSGLGVAGLALAPALIPIGASVAGLAAALSVPVVAAGGGLTIFGFIAGKAMKDTEKVGKQIDALKKKAETLTSPTARQAALDQAKALEESLTGPQKAFLAAQTALSKAFSSLTQTAGPALFKPLVAGMDALAGLLPKTAPLLAAVSSALTDVIRSASQSGAFDGFLNFLTKASGPAIRGFADIAGNIAKGIGGIGKAFEPLAGPVVGAIENMARSFSHIGSSKGLADFVDYVRQNGPLVASTLVDVGKATAGLVRDLAPAGPDILRVVDALAKLTLLYQKSGALQKAVTGIGDAFRITGHAIRTDWNDIIQPVLHGIVDGLGHVAVAEGRMLQALGHVPGFGWAKVAGNLLVAAGRDAEGLARSIHKIPSHASTLYGFVGQGAALSAIARIKGELAHIPRSVSTAFYVNQLPQNIERNFV